MYVFFNLPKSLSKDFLRFFVIGPANISRRNKEIKWIVSIWIMQSPSLVPLNFSHSLLSMRAEAEFLFVTPQYGWSCLFEFAKINICSSLNEEFHNLHTRSGQQSVQIFNLTNAFISKLYMTGQRTIQRYCHT